MASWVGPTVAIALALIALCVVAAAVVAVSLIREARAKTESLARELAELRTDLAPTLTAINRLTESGGDLVDQVRLEVDAVLDTSRRMRQRVDHGAQQMASRLADLDALLEVATEEADAALLDAANAIQSLRSGAGLLTHVGRFLTSSAEDEEGLDEEEVDEDEEIEDEFEPEQDSDQDDDEHEGDTRAAANSEPPA